MTFTKEDLESIILDAEEVINVPQNNVRVADAAQIITLAQELIAAKLELEKKEIANKSYRAHNIRSSDSPFSGPEAA